MRVTVRIVGALVAVAAALFGLGWLWLRISPKPFATFPQETPELQYVPFSSGLPAPVARYYTTIAGERIPRVTSAVITMRGRLRFAGVTFPARLRFTHDAGQGYRHYIEATLFGYPLLKVNETYLDGRARQALLLGVIENEPKVDMGANLGRWGEPVWLPSIFLTDPRVPWEPLDETTARLIVPCAGEEDAFTVFFDAQTGLIRRMEAMRFREEADPEKILWWFDPLGWLVGGVWLLQGGMYRVITSLEAIAERRGVRFRYHTPVERITVDGPRATGVVLGNGTHLAADVVAANADLPYVYERLLPPEAAPRRLAQMKYTSSAIMFYWGVDRVYPQLRTHNIFMGGDYRASFDRIFRDQNLPEEPSFYVHAPARSDPTAAPPGADTLMVLVPVGHLDAGAGQAWDKLQAQARAAVLQRLAAAGLADLPVHLKFEVSFTPCHWQRLYNLASGAAFGLSHNVWQVGYLRPHNRHHHYHNLYFAGSSTHPGAGVPLALLSARLTTEGIVQEMARYQSKSE